MKFLDDAESRHEVDIRTVDSLASSALPEDFRSREPLQNFGKLRSLIKEAIQQCRNSNKDFSFTDQDAEFIEQEIDWVIFGQGLMNLEEYLDVDRVGRGRPLQQQQRRNGCLKHTQPA